MALESISAFKSCVDKYICCANEAVNFKMVSKAADIEDQEKVFHPDMSHQIFGDKEQIFGYSDLAVNIYYTASQLRGYVAMKYSGKIDPNKYDGVEVDDVINKMVDVLPPGYTSNLDEFSILLEKDQDFKPHGRLVYQYQRNGKDGSEHCFEMYNPSMADYSDFRSYHARMQTFLMWFVDAASYIDVDDEKWEYYTLYEKKTNEGQPLYIFVGYCTVYNFYAYPVHCRPRISQFLILPPYQRQGHATEVLEAIYRCFLARSNVRDICVEDPSENFQRVRDFVDCRKCMDLDCFLPEKIVNGYTAAMTKECNEKLKLNKRQTRRVYEILRLKYTNTFDEKSFRPYRLAVKRRLNMPFTTKNLGKKFVKSIVPPPEERFAILDREFLQVLEQYLPVVKRLNMCPK